MSISEKLKKLIKTLGGVPKSDTIEGAVDDLVGLFEEKREVEMVEIVPEQSVTGKYNSHSGKNVAIIQKNETPVTVGVEYVVIFNDERYKVEAVDDGDGVFLYNEILQVNFERNSSVKLFWPTEYGETITIAIYEEQVTVTPPVASVTKNPDMVITLDGCGLTNNITTDDVVITSGTVSDVIEKIFNGIPADIRVRGFFNHDDYWVESNETKANVIYYAGVLHINYIVSHTTDGDVLAKHIAINEDGVIIEVNNRSINGV